MMPKPFMSHTSQQPYEMAVFVSATIEGGNGGQEKLIACSKQTADSRKLASKC